MSKATVIKEKAKRGKQPTYIVKQGGKEVARFDDNGKLGIGGARDLAQNEARRRNS